MEYNVGHAAGNVGHGPRVLLDDGHLLRRAFPAYASSFYKSCYSVDTARYQFDPVEEVIRNLEMTFDKFEIQDNLYRVDAARHQFGTVDEVVRNLEMTFDEFEIQNNLYCADAAPNQFDSVGEVIRNLEMTFDEFEIQNNLQPTDQAVDEVIKNLNMTFDEFEVQNNLQPTDQAADMLCASPAPMDCDGPAAVPGLSTPSLWSSFPNMQQGTVPMMAPPVSYCVDMFANDKAPAADAAGGDKQKGKSSRRRKKDILVDDLLNDPASTIGGAGSTSTTIKNKKAAPRKRKNKQDIADDLVNDHVRNAAGKSASTAKGKKGKGRRGRKRIYGMQPTEGDQPGNSSAAKENTTFIKKEEFKMANPQWLPRDWYIMGRLRPNGQIDKYYYEPGGLVYTTSLQVKDLLGLNNSTEPDAMENPFVMKRTIFEPFVDGLPKTWCREAHFRKETGTAKDWYYYERGTRERRRSKPDVERYLQETSNQEGSENSRAPKRRRQRKRMYIVKELEDEQDGAAA